MGPFKIINKVTEVLYRLDLHQENGRVVEASLGPFSLNPLICSCTLFYLSLALAQGHISNISNIIARGHISNINNIIARGHISNISNIIARGHICDGARAPPLQLAWRNLRSSPVPCIYCP